MIGIALVMTIGAVTTAATPTPAKKPQTLAVVSTITVNVSEPQRCADSIVTEAQKLGGYLTELTDGSVSVKVPTAKLETLKRFAEKQGQVLQRTHQATDLRMQLLSKHTQLGSKEKMLKRYMNVLDHARVSAVVSVEQQILQLVSEIEILKGAIRVLKHRLAMASLRVNFRIQAPTTPVVDGSSPFPWLNEVNLSDLNNDFAHVPD